MSDREAPAVLTAVLPLSQDCERLLEHYCAEPAHMAKFELSSQFENPQLLKSFALGGIGPSTKPKSLPKEILGAKIAEIPPQPSDAITAPLLDFVMLALDRKEEPNSDVLSLLDSLRNSVKFLDPQNSAYSTQIRTKVKKVIQLGLAAAQRFRTNPTITASIFKSCVYLASIVGKMSLYLEILVKAAELNLLDEIHIPDFSHLAISRGTKFKILQVKKPISGVIKQQRYDGHTLPSESHKHANTMFHFDHYRLLMDQGDYFTLMNRYPCPVTSEQSKEKNQFSIIYQFRNSGLRIHTGLGNIWASQYSDIGVLANRNRGYSRVWNFNFNKHENMSNQQLDAKLRPIKPDFGNASTAYHCGNHEEFFYRVSFFKSNKTGIPEATSKVITIAKYANGIERYAYQQALSEIPIKSDDNVFFGWPDTEATHHRVLLLNGLLVLVGHNKNYWIVEPSTGTLFAQGVLSEAINGIDYLRREAVQASGTVLTYFPYEFFFQYSFFRQTLLKLNSDVSTSGDKPQMNIIDVLGLKQGEDSFEESDYEDETQPPAKSEPTETNPPVEPSKVPEVTAASAAAEAEPKDSVSAAPTGSATPSKPLTKEAGKVCAAYLELLSALAFESEPIESLETLKPQDRNQFLTSFDGVEPIPATFNSLLSLLEFLFSSLKGHAFYDSILISLLHLLKVHIDRIDLVQDRQTTGVRLVTIETLAKIGQLLLQNCPELPTDIAVDGKKKTVFLEPEELTFVRGWILAKIYLVGVTDINKDGVLFKHLISYNVLFPRNLMKRVLREFEQNMITKTGITEEAKKSVLKDPTITVILGFIKKAAEFEKEVLPNHHTFENKQRPVHPELKYLQENLRPVISFLSDSKSPLFDQNEGIIAALLEIFDISIEGFKLAANLMRDHGSFGQDSHYDFGHVWLNTVGMQLHQYLIKTPERLQADIRIVSVLQLVPESVQEYPEIDNFGEQLNHIYIDSLNAQKRHFCSRILIDLPDDDFKISTEGAIIAKFFRDSPNSIVVWGYLHEATKGHTKPQIKVETYSGRSRRLFYQGYQGYLKKRWLEVRAALLKMISELTPYQYEIQEWNMVAAENLQFRSGVWLESEMDMQAVWSELLKLAPAQESPATVKSEDVPKDEATAIEEPAKETPEPVLTTPPISPRGPQTQAKEQPEPQEVLSTIEGAVDKVAQILKLDISADDKAILLQVLKRKSVKQQWNWIILWAHLMPCQTAEEQAATLLKMKRSAILFSSTRVIKLAISQQLAKESFSNLVSFFTKIGDSNKAVALTCHLFASVIQSEKDVVKVMTSGQLLIADVEFEKTMDSLQSLVNDFSIAVYSKVTSDNQQDYMMKMQYYGLAGLASLSQYLGAAIKFDILKILAAQTRLKEIGSENVNQHLRTIASRTKQGWQYLCESLQKMKPSEVCTDPEETDGAFEVKEISVSGNIPSFVWEFLTAVDSFKSEEVHTEVFSTPDSSESLQENYMCGYPETGREGGQLTEVLEAIERALLSESSDNLVEMINSKYFPIAKLAELLVSPVSPPKVFSACSRVLVKVAPHLAREDSRVAKVLKDTLELLAGSLERYFSCISQRSFNNHRKGSPSPGIFLLIMKAYAALKSPSSLWLNELQPSALLEATNGLPELVKFQKLVRTLANPDTPQSIRPSLLRQAEDLLARSIQPAPLEYAELPFKVDGSDECSIKAMKLRLAEGNSTKGLFERLAGKVYSEKKLVHPTLSKVVHQSDDIAIKIQRQLALEGLLDFSTSSELPERKLITICVDKPQEKLDLSEYASWILISSNFESRIETSTLVDPKSCYLSEVDAKTICSVPSTVLLALSSGVSFESISISATAFQVVSCDPPPILAESKTRRTFVLIPDPSRLSLTQLHHLSSKLASASHKASPSRQQRVSALFQQLQVLSPSDKLPRIKPTDLSTLVHVFVGSGGLLGELERRDGLLREKGGSNAPRELREVDWVEGEIGVEGIVRLRKVLQKGHVSQRRELMKRAVGKVWDILGHHSASIWVDYGLEDCSLDVGQSYSSSWIDELISEFLGAALGNMYLLQLETSSVKLADLICEFIVKSELDANPKLLLFTDTDENTKYRDFIHSISSSNQPEAIQNILLEKQKLADQFVDLLTPSIKRSLELIRKGFFAVVGDLLIPTETSHSLRSLFANTPSQDPSNSIPPVILWRLFKLYQDAKQEPKLQPLTIQPGPIKSQAATTDPKDPKATAQATPPPPPPPPEEEEEISLGGLFD